MADRWYLKGIHVPVNRFGSEENKKRESPTNRTARVSNRHSFSPSGEKSKVETSKDTLISLKQR